MQLRDSRASSVQVKNHDIVIVIKIPENIQRYLRVTVVVRFVGFDEQICHSFGINWPRTTVPWTLPWKGVISLGYYLTRAGSYNVWGIL